MIPQEAIPRIIDAETLVFSAENPNGAKGGGSHSGPLEKLRPRISIEPGQTATLLEMDGSGYVQSMWFGGYTGWEMILRIYWDNQEMPSVECPLCAFFAFGFNVYENDEHKFPVLNSAKVLVSPCRGMNCYWVMPFRKHCRITLENRSDSTKNSYYTITACKTNVPDDIAYFHAAYRQAFPVEKNTEFTIIDGIKGKGYLAGVSMAIGTNGNNGCFVEGEVKCFIDGDAYPTINYTGAEDYFGGSYAFGYDNGLYEYQEYSGLYHGMFYAHTHGDCGRRYNYQPRFMMYRWHVTDPIYFSEDFKMTVQDLPRCRDDFASVCYWYQTLPTMPFLPLPDVCETDRT